MSLARMASVDYLVGHVAAGDGSAHAQVSGMTRYYTAAGYPPGTWLGTGVTALHPDRAGSVVTAEQLRLLFEQARDPFTGAALGRPPARYPTRQERIERRVAALPVDMTREARAAAVGRIEAEEKEHKTRSAVAGFDLTFSVPKSVSALWAIAPAGTQQDLYDAHRAALEATIGLIEVEAVFTRTGARGARRVRTTGLIAAAFDHWDSRKGDPQLHTHVVIANRVQTKDGRWRTLDSATLHRAVVAYSATYNQLLADEVTRRTGLTWTTRERTHGSNRRVGRELAVVPEALTAVFSQRSADIEAAVDAAIAAQVERTGRRPSVRSINRIRQHLTLTTRDRKQHPSLAAAVQQWDATAAAVLGRDPARWAADAISANVPNTSRISRAAGFDDADVNLLALRVLDTVAAARSTWTRWNLTAETMRQLSAENLHFTTAEQAVAMRDRVVAAAERLSVQVTAPELATVPDTFRDLDGTSQLAHPTVYTSRRVLEAEDTLLALAEDSTGPRVAEHRAHAVAAWPLPGRAHALARDDQAPAAVAVVTSGRVVDVLVGPAGTGKTTSLAGIRAMWEAEHGPGSVVGLAPSAIAAQVLASDLGITTDNTAQWLAQQHQQSAREQRIAALLEQRDRETSEGRDTRRLDSQLGAVRAAFDRWRLRPGQLLIVDEAGLAGTFTLTALAEQAKSAGAKLLLVGDPHQLSPIATGGAFTLLVTSRPDPPTLTVVRRFVNPDGTRRSWEEVAAARLRVGDPQAVHAYRSHGRVHAGTTDTITEAAYAAWLTDTRAGRSSVLIAATTDQVRSLNERARADLVDAETVDGKRTLVLHDGLPVGRGDRIVTRRIERHIPDGTAGPGRDARWEGFVRNGQHWRVDRVHRDGSLTVRLLDDTDNANQITLPAGYVRNHVELGYAVTAHRAQGVTVDTAHVLADTSTTREVFYVAMTRGRHANHAYLTLNDATRNDVHDLAGEPDPSTPGEVLAAIAQNTSAEPSAHHAIRAEQDRATSIATLAAEADTIATHAHYTATANLLTEVLGDTPSVQRVLTVDDYPRVITAVRAVRAAGLDVPETIHTSGGRLQAGHALTARALADSLHRSAATSTPTRPRLVAGLIPDATPGITDPQALHALRERYQLIEHRADTLLDSEIAADAPWLRRIPRNGADTDRWRATARVVAAYRDRWGITGTQALGPTPDSTAPHAHHADHRRATNALAIHYSTQGLGNPAPVASAPRATSPRNL